MRSHQVALMVEMGDLREGIMPCDLNSMVTEVLALPNIVFRGIGTNLACRSGISPDAVNMSALSTLAAGIEATFQLTLAMVSGGNSANIQRALNKPINGPTLINDLRLGEAILLGCEPLYRQLITGLYTDAITLVAEVIEVKSKPSQPWGDVAQNAFGDVLSPINNNDDSKTKQAILAIGIQDTDPNGLQAKGIKILGASSDHLVVEAAGGNIVVGQEVRFQLNYSALLRAMTSPFVSKFFTKNLTDQYGLRSWFYSNKNIFSALL